MVAPAKAANKLLPFGDGETVGLGDGETVGVGDGETVGVGDGETDGLGEGETDGLGDGDPLGEAVGVGVEPPPLNTPERITVLPFLT